MTDSPAPSRKLPLKDRFKATLDAYGPLVLGLYLFTSVVVFVGFMLALQLGFEVKSAGGTAGTLAGAWVALKLTQPFRIAGTLAAAPVVKRALGRFQKK